MRDSGLVDNSGDMKAPDRAYMSEQIDWNYKLPEVNSALARVRLRHLDAYIDGCVSNADYLSKKLQGIQGVIPPSVPEGHYHTYYLYSVELDTSALGLDIEVGRLRNAVMKALAAENVDVMRWQKVPVPSQPMFQNKIAYGNGSPWNCPAGDVSYDVEQYPNAFASLENSFVVRRIVPPNGVELMDRYAAAFAKVFGQIERVIELYDQTETYVPLEQRKAHLATGKI